jgi:hypothetical protein
VSAPVTHGRVELAVFAFHWVAFHCGEYANQQLARFAERDLSCGDGCLHSNLEIGH